MFLRIPGLSTALTVTALMTLLMAMPLTASVFSVDDWLQRAQAETSIDQLGRLYIEFLMEEDPTNSGGFGIHGRGDDANYYDQRLPDISAPTLATAAQGRAAFLQRLQAIDADQLSRPDQIDLHILTQRVKLDQLNSEKLAALQNPLNWVTSLGEAMSSLLLRDYAPLEQRLESFAARCAATPAFLGQAQSLLMPDSVRPTEMEKKVTLQRLAGMQREGTLYDKTMPGLLTDAKLSAEQKASISESCAVALQSIAGFANWFEAIMVPRPDSDWRIGKALYDEKYALQMDYPLDAEQLLAVAIGWLAVTGNELVSTGREIHDAYLADEIAAGTVQKAATLEDQQVVRDIFAKLSEDRSTPETLIADSYAMADSIISFVREQNLLDLPPASKLRIEPIPPHLAGNAVAMIQTAPPFEPELESVWFWDLELLATSPSYLKEYNRPTLATVYIHEGVPGHFVQLEYSNRSERIIPRVFWNGPMVEGWAAYIVTQMVEQGFTVYPDHPQGHQLQQMVDNKMTLRSVINAIIDIRLHRTNWPIEEAVKLMVEQGYQEEGEAQGKAVRAQLGSVQLASYFAGQLAIEDILVEYKAKKGKSFSYKEFNEKLVGAGSPPFFAIREFMLSD
ncbi:MAG: DUF885 domain-containing protein [Xanthomonadales bacterium]|nr:DUF885 domain-containing protein [Xanthomonadales bacterium]